MADVCLHFCGCPARIACSRGARVEVENRELHLLQSKGGASIAAGGVRLSLTCLYGAKMDSVGYVACDRAESADQYCFTKVTLCWRRAASYFAQKSALACDIKSLMTLKVDTRYDNFASYVFHQLYIYILIEPPI